MQQLGADVNAPANSGDTLLGLDQTMGQTQTSVQSQETLNNITDQEMDRDERPMFRPEVEHTGTPPNINSEDVTFSLGNAGKKDRAVFALQNIGIGAVNAGKLNAEAPALRDAAGGNTIPYADVANDPTSALMIINEYFGRDFVSSFSQSSLELGLGVAALYFSGNYIPLYRAFGFTAVQVLLNLNPKAIQDYPLLKPILGLANNPSTVYDIFYARETSFYTKAAFSVNVVANYFLTTGNNLSLTQNYLAAAPGAGYFLYGIGKSLSNLWDSYNGKIFFTKAVSEGVILFHTAKNVLKIYNSLLAYGEQVLTKLQLQLSSSIEGVNKRRQKAMIIHLCMWLRVQSW